LAQCLGHPLPGFLYDASGDYNTFLVIAAALVLVAVLLINIGSGKKAYEKVESLELHINNDMLDPISAG
jgi:cyanate permease